MNAIKSISVTVDGRTFVPWATRYVRVEAQKCYQIHCPFSLMLGRLVARNMDAETVFSVKKESLFVSTYVMERPGRETIKIRKVSTGYWICQEGKRTWEVHRYSSIKCILSTEGRQMGIMSLNANLPFTDEGEIFLRVHDRRYLDLSIAVALLVDGFSLNLSPILLNNNKVTAAQPV